MSRRRPQITLEIEGIDELERKFRRMPRKMSAKVLVDASRHGARPILEEAQQRAPRDRGVLASRGLKLKTTKRSQFYGEVSVTNTKPGAHAVLQEFGVKPHFQKKRRRHHPGHEAQPFMRPAYDAKKKDAVRITRRKLREALKRAIR